MLRHCFITVVICVATLCFHKAYPQSASIALPSGTVGGHLDNGFHYLILPNATPSSKVEFRLIMRVGSLQETETERGCAHFLEHMAFGGTRHFPKRTLVESLEKLGMKYGQDINALTGFDRTIYMFAVPVDKDKEVIIDHSLSIVRDWMDGIVIEPTKVESEKGIILEELRSYDLGDEFYDLKIGDGLFSRRIPLGSAEDIRSVTPEKLEGYYCKWYVPNAATLVVVGDVCADHVEQRVKEMFSSLTHSPSPIRLTPSTLNYSPGIAVSEVRDSLRTCTRMEWIIPHPCVVERTLDDAVRKRQERLLVKAINARLQARGLSCDVSDHWYLSDKSHFVLAAEGKDRRELLSRMSRMITELYALAREGWDPNEWNDIRGQFCDSYEKCKATVLPRSSSSWCDDFVDYVISGDRYLTDKRQDEYVRRALRTTEAAEVRDLLTQWLGYKEEALLVACLSHPGFGSEPLTDEEIATAWKKGECDEYVPYVYRAQPSSKLEVSLDTPACLAVLPPFDPSHIVEDKTYARTKIREVTLRNGIKLVLRPTSQSDSTLLLTSFAPFGLSSLSEKDYPLLEGTASYMDMGGVAKACGGRLTDYLYDNEMSLTTVIENHWHGFMGMAPTTNATELFNLIYEKIREPELNYADFEESRKELLKSADRETTLEKMLKRDPQRLLTARINELMGLSLPASRHQTTREELHRLRLDSIAHFYRSLYGRPEGTTYVVCGNFDADTLIRRFVAVFGRMVPSSTRSSWEYSTFQLPDTTIYEHFVGVGETQTEFNYLFYGYYPPGVQNSLVLKLMCNIIRNRLISVLREQESLVYSPYVSLEYEAIPWGTFYFNVNASADHKNMPRIEEILLSLLRQLQREEVEKSELDSLKRSFLIAKREALNEESPSSWRTSLTSLLKNGETVADFEAYETILDGITPSLLREAFATLVDVDKYALLYISKNRIEKQ